MGDPVERYNRTFFNMLKAIPDKEKKRWKDQLPKLTFAYNSTVHKATFLMFGRESRLRVDGAHPTFDKNPTAVGNLRPTHVKFQNSGKTL